MRTCICIAVAFLALETAQGLKSQKGSKPMIMIDGNGKQFDHISHAVTGPDQTVFASTSGKAKVHLDGKGSHSHYFNAGPPVVHGKIVKWAWSLKGKVFCKKQKCTHQFPVGIHTVYLKVTDNINDSSTDSMKIIVRPASQATGKAKIKSIAPTSGPLAGGTSVTIDGENFYSEGLVVKFGSKTATAVQVVSTSQVIATSPSSAAGTVQVQIKTKNGQSNGKTFAYTAGAKTVNFREDEWKNSDGTTFSAAKQVSSITVGQDGRYYMGTLDGKVFAVDVGEDLVVKNYCSAQVVNKSRSIYAIAYNPADKKNRLVISTNTQFWKRKGETWYNGKVEWVDVNDNDCVSHGGVIIKGLPVSNHDHGVSGIVFLPNGKMLVSVGGTTNAGVSKPDDKLGGVPESPFSGAVVQANYLKDGFVGEIGYDQVHNPGTARVVGGNVWLFAQGFRNAFGIARSDLTGKIYVMDNGPNKNFGAKSISCTKEVKDPADGDSLYLIEQGKFYGHPNRNRGRVHPRQCTWRGPGATPALASQIQPSTNGIVPYKSNVFEGQLKGDLFLSKAALGGEDPGKVFRVEMNAKGTKINAGPYLFKSVGGLSMIEGKFGELIMPQLRKGRVLVLVPNSGVTVRTAMEASELGAEVTRVFPACGPESGGVRILVTGHNFDDTDTVRLGGKVCTDVEVVSKSQIRCTAPPGFGSVSVTVEKNGLTSPTYDYDFTYLRSTGH